MPQDSPAGELLISTKKKSPSPGVNGETFPSSPGHQKPLEPKEGQIRGFGVLFFSTGK